MRRKLAQRGAGVEGGGGVGHSILSSPLKNPIIYNNITVGYAITIETDFILTSIYGCCPKIGRSCPENKLQSFFLFFFNPNICTWKISGGPGRSSRDFPAKGSAAINRPENFALCLWYHGPTSRVASFLVLGGGGGGKTPKCTDKKKYMYLYCASERLKNIHFQDSKYMHTCTINAVSFNYLWYGAIYERHYTDKTLIFRRTKVMNMRASWIFFTFSHSKTAISFNILLVLQILCLGNILIFRSQITSAYIIHNQCIFLKFITYGMMLYKRVKRQYTDKTLTLRKCIYASERSERA